MNKKNWLFIGIVFSLLLSGLVFFTGDIAQAKTKNYSISPTSKPINKTYAKSKNYNNSTKHYYLLRSYLEQIEKNGGGTLQLKKGTYTISNVLYLPSNTTLKLHNGVIIKKGTTTGKASFSPGKSLIQVIDPKKLKRSVKKYEGASNAKITGSGNATIDMNNFSNAHGVVMAHSKNILISGVQFKRNHNASFIHIIGSNNVKIDKNKFFNATAQTKLPSIRIESAVKATSVYKTAWNKLDGTNNSKVDITRNQFANQYNAIKTSDFIEGKFQQSISITDNRFRNIQNDTLYMSAWNKPVIKNNSFDDRREAAAQTILARAVKFPTIRGNSFINSTKIISFRNVTSKNKVSVSANGSTSVNNVAKIQNEMTLANKHDLSINNVTDLKDYKIKLPIGDYKETGNVLELYNEKDLEKDVYMFNSSSRSLNLSYTLRPSYTKMTRDYYVLRSIVEQLERQGGGTIFIEKGDYSFTNTIYVPSNVTIELEDGTVLRKSIVTDTPTMNLSSSIFQLVPPSKSTGKGTVGKYNGTKNVKIFSKGRATLDLQNKFFSFAIIMGHTENIQFENLDFINMNSGHFIELNASKDVNIFNCSFKYSIPSDGFMKEAINIDTPDLATKGFNLLWSNFDRTPTENVTIQNSIFEDLDRAIGTHKYSGMGIINGVQHKSMLHKNVKIINNTFMDIRNDAIRIMNWDRPTIIDNTFTNIGLGNAGKRGLIGSGVYLPNIQNNHFENTGRPMQFFPWKNNGYGKEYEIIYNEFDAASLEAFANNTGTNMVEYFIRIADEYQIYTQPQKVNILVK